MLDIKAMGIYSTIRTLKVPANSKSDDNSVLRLGYEWKPTQVFKSARFLFRILTKIPKWLYIQERIDSRAGNQRGLSLCLKEFGKILFRVSLQKNPTNTCVTTWEEIDSRSWSEWGEDETGTRETESLGWAAIRLSEDISNLIMLTSRHQSN